MEYVNTMARLITLIDAREDAISSWSARNALTRLIEAQVDRVKINIMTHCFSALDYFNGKE